jgi:hypothetical protein
VNEVKFAHKKFTVDARQATNDGYFETINGKQFYFEGDWILTDMLGNSFVLTDKRFKEWYVPVEVKQKRNSKELSPFEEQYYINAFAEMSQLNQEEDVDYIEGTKKLIENKKL